MVRPLLLLWMAAALTPLQSEPGRAPDLASVRAALDAGLYVQAEDAARAYVSEISAVGGDDSLAAAAASDWYLRALLLNGKGGRPSTRTLAEETVRRKDRVLGPTHRELVPSLLNWARTLTLAAQHQEAIAVAQRAVTLEEAANEMPGPGLIQALDGLGRALDSGGKYDEAIATLQRAVSLQDAAGVPARSIANALQALASVLQLNGDYAAARRALERAMAMLDSSGREHPSAVDTWIQLGVQLWFEGRLTESRETLNTAVRLAERTLRPDHPSLAYALRNLAATCLDLGDLATARSLQQRALSIIERSLGDESHETAAYLNSLANSSMLLGDYPAARRLYEQALTIARVRLGEGHEWTATFIHNLALVDSALGDFAAARREHARAVAIWERVLGKDHPVIAVALSEMATVLRREGNPAAAIPLLNRALAIRKSRLDAMQREVGRTLADLAWALDQVGQVTRARELSKQAVELFEAMPDPPAPDLAAVLLLSGELHVRRGDYTTAFAQYRRARDLRVGVFGPTHPLVAEAEAGLAVVQAAAGDGTAAFASAAAAETSGREHLRLTVRYLPERESLAYVRSRPRGLDVMLSLVPTAPDAVEATLDAVIRGRALVLDEMLMRRGAAAEQGPTLVDAEARLHTTRQRLANVIVRGFDGASGPSYRAVLDDATRESEAAERALAEMSATYGAYRGRTQAGLREVTAALPPDSALVSFLRYDRLVFNQSSTTAIREPGRIRRAPSYMAFVMRSGQPPSAIPLGSAAEIERLVTEWRKHIAAEALAAAGPGDAGDSRRIGLQLRRRVWDPLRSAIEGRTRVFIVPDGALNLVPFAALPDGAQGFLIEQAAVVHYLAAERDVIDAPVAVPPGRGLLALGGAAFGRSPARRPSQTTRRATSGEQDGRLPGSGCTPFERVQFEPLSGSLEEVKQIANVWSASGHRGEGMRMLTGEAAGEDVFTSQAPGTRVLHLATHAVFVSDNCAEAIRGTRAVGGLAPARSRSAATTDPPLVLSALALASANGRRSAREDAADGILTAQEVASMRLEGVDWAVLSGCDTGLGVLMGGEGVLGLRRAFQIAGVRTVITSLWPVEDRATGRFMRELYAGRFLRGLSSDDAMRTATLAVLRQRRAAAQSTHPFFWAAFVAAGAWR